MNIPRDLVFCIFLRVDGESLLQSMSTCKSVAQIINEIIQEAMHDDIYEHLFRIHTLSHVTLTKYLNKILISDDKKYANLILAAFVVNKLEFLQNVWILMKSIYDWTKTMGSNDLVRMCSNDDFMRTDYYYNNKIFKLIPHGKHDKMDFYIDMKKYFNIWWTTLLRADRLDIVDRMYHRNYVFQYKKNIIRWQKEYIQSVQEYMDIINSLPHTLE